MEYNNVFSIGFDGQHTNSTEIYKVNEDTKTNYFRLSRQNQGYYSLLSFLKEIPSSDSSPNFYNVNELSDVYIDDVNSAKMFSIVDSIETDTDKTNLLSSRPFPLVEIPGESHKPFVDIFIPESLTHNKGFYKYNFKVFTKKKCKILIKKFYKALTLTDEDLEDIYLSCYEQPVGSDLRVRIRACNLYVKHNTHLAICEKFKKEIESKYPLFQVKVPKYNTISATSIFAVESRWTKVGFYDYEDEEIEECDITKYIDDNYQNGNSIFYNSELTSINYYRNEPLNVIFNEVEVATVEITEEQYDLEYITLINNNERARQIDIILNYINEKYFRDESLFSEMINSFYLERFLKPVFRHHFLKYNTVDNFKKIWKTRTYSEVVDAGFYFRMVMNENGFKQRKHKSQFEIEYDEFIVNRIHSRMEENDGMLNETIWSSIINYIVAGKYYTVPDEDKPKTYWYEFVTERDEPAPGDLYKWRKTLGCPKSLILSIIDKIMVNYCDAIINKLDDAEADKSTRKLVKNIKSAKRNLGTNAKQKQISFKLAMYLNNSNFYRLLNKRDDVIGVQNGVLCLDLYSSNPQPYLCNIESKFNTTKRINAIYDPNINRDHYAYKKIMIIISDIVIEIDARDEILYYKSTGLDNLLHVEEIISICGCGSNGKSFIADGTLYLMGDDYSVKPKPSLYLGTPPPGSADPDMMELEGKRISITTEFKPNMVLDSQRSKEITEYKKNGRLLNENNKSFTGYTTHFRYSNYLLLINEPDEGTWRRERVYNTKVKFVSNPTKENERKANVKYKQLIQTIPMYASALLNILIDYRIALKTKFDDDIKKVFSDTINKESFDYRMKQDKVARFIYERIVIMFGYDKNGLCGDYDKCNRYYEDNKIYDVSHSVSMNSIVKAYRDWYRVKYSNRINIDFDTISSQFKESSLSNYYHNSFEEGEFFRGLRITCDDAPKLPEETISIKGF